MALVYSYHIELTLKESYDYSSAYEITMHNHYRFGKSSVTDYSYSGKTS